MPLPRRCPSVAVTLSLICAVLLDVPFVWAQSDPGSLPIHPGIPGVRPFWTGHTRRFIAPPAFECDSVGGVKTYILTAVSSRDSVQHSFTASTPWADLSPIWRQLPVGEVHLIVRAVSGRDTLLLLERDFIKSPAYSGPYGSPAYDYRESARRCLASLYHQEKVQHWFQAGKPDSFYPKYIYPAKMIGGVILGMGAYADLAVDPQERKNALTIAESAARFLISLSPPKGAPLAFWPPTFWSGVDRDIHPVFEGETMALEPSETALAYLDLYRRTGNDLYLSTAKGIGETYARLQLSSGTWYQRLDVRTGGPKEQNLLVPISIIILFDELIEKCGMGELRTARARAFSWCMTHPVETFNWEAQFEDTRPRDLYRNLSHREPVQFATLLLRTASGHRKQVELAEELLRFAEDSFVIWEKSDPLLRAQLFKPNARWNGNDPYFGSDWFVPAATEQYLFPTPINGSSAAFIEGYLEAYKATGKSVYRDKARSLAITLTVAQRYWGGGEIPTHLRRVMPELNWLNASVYTALVLLRHADELRVE
jgi:hypothetical protein